jgi:hypothetical protein
VTPASPTTARADIERAMELTHAGTKKEMVTTAISELVSRRSQLEMIDWIEGGGLPDIADPEVLSDARR